MTIIAAVLEINAVSMFENILFSAVLINWGKFKLNPKISYPEPGNEMINLKNPGETRRVGNPGISLDLSADLSYISK